METKSQMDMDTKLISSSDEIISRIENSSWIPARKKLFIDFYQSLSANQKAAYASKRFNQWLKNKEFIQAKESQITNSIGQFSFAGIMQVLMETIVVHFLLSIVFNHYFINFSVDAIVASLCAVMLYVNVKSKYRELKSFGILKDYVYMDVLCLVGAVLVEMMVGRYGFDVSIFLFIGSYYLQKRKFKFWLENTYKKNL